MNERTIQIDVIGKIEGTQFMKCKLFYLKILSLS